MLPSDFIIVSFQYALSWRISTLSLYSSNATAFLWRVLFWCWGIFSSKCDSTTRLTGGGDSTTPRHSLTLRVHVPRWQLPLDLKRVEQNSCKPELPSSAPRAEPCVPVCPCVMRCPWQGGPGTSRKWAKIREHIWRRLGKLIVSCSWLGKLARGWASLLSSQKNTKIFM